MEMFKNLSPEVADFFIKTLGNRIDSATFLLLSNNFDLYKYYDVKFSALVNLEKVNHHRRINKFFEAVNFKLDQGGIYISSVETYTNRKKFLLNKFPVGFKNLVFGFDILLNRFFPKLKLTQKLYFYLTRGKYRMISRSEVLGRLYSCGFEVIAEEEIDNILYFAARKIQKPIFDREPSYGPIVKLRRVGKRGENINVYKFRTMYPYSEYLQAYIFKNNCLDEGGKFKDDFRISSLGRFLRKYWLDELPMIWNLIKGDLKIIGVRPISKQYFDLYSKELQEKRIKTKPGLIPPFYADMPKTLEEIIGSEMRYLNAYEKAPLQTDLKYFGLIFKNIVLKGVRSK